MAIRDNAGHDLAIQIFDALEQGYLGRDLRERAGEYGFKSQLNQMVRFRVERGLVEDIARDGQLYHVAYSIGRMDGEISATRIPGVDELEEFAITVTDEYREALNTWIRDNRIALSNATEGRDPDTVASMRAEEIIDMRRMLEEAGRTLVSERYTDGFVDGVSLAWMRRVAPGMIDSLRREAEGVLADPLRGADDIEVRIQSYTVQLAAPIDPQLSRRAPVVICADRGVWSDVADAGARKDLYNWFTKRHVRGADPIATLDLVRRDLYAVFRALEERGSSNGMAWVSRVFSLPVTDRYLDQVAEYAERNFGATGQSM